MSESKPKSKPKSKSKCVCGRIIKGKKFTVMENILGEKVIKQYHADCFEEMVLGVKSNDDK